MTQMAQQPVILASGSPHRREILQNLGIDATISPAGIDESRLNEEDPAEYVERLAREKVLACVAGGVPAGARVVAADTAVVIDAEVLGKPRDRAVALAMLARLSARSHHVVTGVAVSYGDALLSDVSRTRVRFRPISEAEACAYWDSGEPADKAGAYAIQGLGAIFAESIDGSHSGVVGLPVFETLRLLKATGFELFGAYARG